MTVRRTITLAAALLASVLLLAGCGSEMSKSEYQKEVKKIGDTVQKDFDKLDSGTPDAKTISGAQDTLEKAADDLADLNPPKDVADLNDELVSVLRDTAKVFGAMAPLMEKAAKDPTSLDEGDTKAMEKVQTDFGKIQERMDKVQKGFKDKGYEVGLDN
ncbi:MAG: hypothetical protein KDC46_01045 [Thermoleophilia bacterium]|nr:hypothetical protein [Thermoleophilia bacterium]